MTETVSKTAKIQCPCGRSIEDASDYKLLFLKKEMNEIDILCPNDACYLRELGFVLFSIKNENPQLNKAKFYVPYVTWNAAQLGEEKSRKKLREHLITLVKKEIDWDKIIEDIKDLGTEQNRAIEST